MPGRYLKRSSELGRLVIPTMAPTSDQRVAGFSFLRRCSSPGERTLVSTDESVSWAVLGCSAPSPLEINTSPDRPAARAVGDDAGAACDADAGASSDGSPLDAALGPSGGDSAAGSDAVELCSGSGCVCAWAETQSVTSSANSLTQAWSNLRRVRRDFDSWRVAPESSSTQGCPKLTRDLIECGIEHHIHFLVREGSGLCLVKSGLGISVGHTK